MVDHVKYLGVIIDSKLTWQQHINYLTVKISRSLYMLSKLKYTLNTKTLLTLYYTLIYPYYNYCCTVWGTAAECHLNRLKLFQKRAVRIIQKQNYLAHTEPIFKDLHILKLKQIINKSILLFMFKYKNSLLPVACENLVDINNKTNDVNSQNLNRYNLRHSEDFKIPRFRTNLRQKSIKIIGAKQWQQIDSEIKTITSLSLFKTKLHEKLLNET